MKQFKECPEFPYFGARYPDACCIDGTLYDLDNCDDEGMLYEQGDNVPCPFCNTDAFIEMHLDDDPESEHNEESLRDKILETYNKYAREPIR